jgi:hypothetical protein
MRALMTRTWAKRIRRLESILQARALPSVIFRYGSVKHLPSDASGERHIVVLNREPTALPNVERCEFEERMGPAPAAHQLTFHVYLSVEDEKENPS